MLNWTLNLSLNARLWQHWSSNKRTSGDVLPLCAVTAVSVY